MVASHVVPNGDLACNRGMCPDWESNWRPFGLQPVLNLLSYTSQGDFYAFYVYEEDPRKLEFIYKKLCTYSYMFKLQCPSK